MSNIFFDLFPIPKFLELAAPGLSISAASISYVNFSHEKGNTLKLKSFDRTELPAGVIENGAIVKPEELAAILSDFSKRNNLYFVRVNLPEEKAFLFRSTIPKMSRDEALEAIQFKIEENVPIAAGEAIFDFMVLEEDQDEQKVMVSVISKQIAYDYLQVLKKSGLNPISFEIESQAIARAVLKRGDEAPVLIINVEKDRLGLYAAQKGIVQFTSTLNLPKYFFQNFASGTLEKKSEKKREGEALDKIIITMAEDEAGKTLKDEIEKILSYWSSWSSARVEKIITCGDAVLDQNFKKYFSAYFSLPIEPANVWVNAFSIDDYVPGLSYEESLKYASAAGLALPRLNLKFTSMSFKVGSIKQKI